MKDLVLKGFVKSFAESNGLPEEITSETFEAFATSVVLRKFHACDIADLDDVLTSGAADAGIDGAAILVNGRPVRSSDDLQFFKSRLRRLDFEFVFVQAKTSPEFDSGGIGTFLYGISQFFSSEPKIPFNDELESLRALKDEVYDLSIAMDDNPSCHAYYVTSGTWNDAPEPRSRIDDGALALRNTNLFSEVRALPLDAEYLKTVFRELERGVTREVELNKTAIFPAIDGVDEAYLGLLSGDQFLNLITNDDGLLNRDLFYDNVRDYQGNNPVNREIAGTMASDNIGRFPLLNNGITIVARSISRTGDVFRISDFQIVNGCQTTHVLFQNQEAISNDTFVPIKLVVTDDSEIITDVIKATNWQTAVRPEALESLTSFHKEIEDIYSTNQSRQPKSKRVYYERRSKQYHFDPIAQSNIVTLTAQTKSFVGMFLNEPHSHHRYYGELLKAYETRIFVSDHQPALYLASGLAFVAVNRLFTKNGFPKVLRSYSYHILMLLRIQLMGYALPRFNSKQATTYAVELIDKLSDESLVANECENSVDIIRAELKQFQDNTRNPPSRLRAFTEVVLDVVRKSDTNVPTQKDEPPPIKIGAFEKGTLKWFDEVKGFGFIERDIGGDIFIHYSGLKDIPWKYWEMGSRLEFQVIQGRKGPQAQAQDVIN